MKFIRGGELYSYMKQAKCFPEERVKFYAIQIAMALGHLHQKQIVYSDLKPENILMEVDGYICMTDDGLTKKIMGDE